MRITRTLAAVAVAVVALTLPACSTTRDAGEATRLQEEIASALATPSPTPTQSDYYTPTPTPTPYGAETKQPFGSSYKFTDYSHNSTGLRVTSGKLKRCKYTYTEYVNNQDEKPYEHYIQTTLTYKNTSDEKISLWPGVFAMTGEEPTASVESSSVPYGDSAIAGGSSLYPGDSRSFTYCFGHYRGNPFSLTIYPYPPLEGKASSTEHITFTDDYEN